MPSLSEATLEVLEPATAAAVLQEVHDVDAAVSRARAAYPAWRAVSPTDRALVRRRIPDAVTAHREELAPLEARNAGKPIGDARGEMDTVAQVFAYHAAAPEPLLGDSIPVSRGPAWTVREPLGVVALIVPLEFPLTIPARKLGAALAAGNTAVRKPAELTPLRALRFAEIAVAAGLPEGVLNTAAGAWWTTLMWPRSRSPAPPRWAARAGRQVAEPRVRRRQPVDAAATAARGTVFGKRRPGLLRSLADLVQRPALHAFMGHLERGVTLLRIGDPLDPDSEMGPLISAAHRERLASFLDDGAPVAFRGRAPDGPGVWFAPTVLCPVDPGARPAREEIFGPVAVVIPFDDEEEAIRLANDTIYGLSGSIWSGDGGRALRVARSLEARVLSINSNTSVRVATPFGGFKQSGYGRELGPHALDAYTEVKSIFFAT